MDQSEHIIHLLNISAKFGWNLFSGLREEDENVTTDVKWWQKLTWPFWHIYNNVKIYPLATVYPNPRVGIIKIPKPLQLLSFSPVLHITSEELRDKGFIP